jgi:hypothetical protein
MKKRAPSLLEVEAAKAASAPSLFLDEEISIEKVGKPEFTGASTGDRLKDQRPDLYRIVVQLLGQGSGVREIMRMTGLHNKTIVAVRDREGVSIDTLRKVHAAGHSMIVELGIELTEEAFTQGTIHGEPVKLRLGDIAMATKLHFDMKQILQGGATSRIEHTEGPTHEDYMKLISGTVIEAETRPVTGLEGGKDSLKVQDEPVEVSAAAAGPALPGEAFPGNLPTGSTENPSPSDEQSDVSTPSISVEAGTDTPFDTLRTLSGDRSAPSSEPVQAASASGSVSRANKRQRPTEGGRGSQKSAAVSKGH